MANIKKKRFKKTKRFVGRIFAFEENKNNYEFIAKLYNDNLRMPHSTSDETPREKLNLKAESEERIKKNLTKQLRIVLVFALLGILAFIIEVIRFRFDGMLVSLVFIAIMLALAFKYHFWRFQVEKGYLGCTFDDWLKATFRRGEG